MYLGKLKMRVEAMMLVVGVGVEEVFIRKPISWYSRFNSHGVNNPGCSVQCRHAATI